MMPQNNPPYFGSRVAFVVALISRSNPFGVTV